MTRILKRKQLIDTASHLFHSRGFYATGIDMILAKAGVSKRTLYKHFPSKNDLILAVVDQYRTNFKTEMRQFLAANQTAEEKILSIFRHIHEQFKDPNFSGCLIVSAVSEFADKDDQIISACQKVKKWQLGMFYSLAQEMQVKDPDTLSYKLFVVFEGLMSAAQVMRRVPAFDTVALVQDILDKAKA